MTMSDTARGWQKTKLLPVEGLVVELGFSRGGWGHRDVGEGIALKFSAEVCGDCFNEAQALLRPVAEFFRNGPQRQEHHVQPVRDNELAPARRGASVLRALPFFHSR
jgi:hypothetical protein